MKFRIVFALFITLAVSTYSQNFTPFRQLKEIETRHFLFIFPEESRRAAFVLAEKADAMYEELVQTLGHDYGSKIPVTITPDQGLFNAFYNPFPYGSIRMFDSNLDPSWAVYAENISAIFYHELTHAISLNIRSGAADFFHGFFGGWFIPNIINTPAFMTEGVTVSFESRGGFGRTNEATVRQRLRQDIFENTFKTPVQAQACLEKYPGGTIFYEYGGLFSRFLQEKYGMEQYAALWKEMGSGFYLSPDWRDSFFYGCFKKVYGFPFEEAWASFRYAYMTIGITTNQNAVKHDLFNISSLARLGGGVAFTDDFSGTLLGIEKIDGEVRTILDTGGDTDCVDFSPDGKKAVLSRLRLSGQLGRKYAEIRDLATGAVSLSVNDVASARLFRSGIVGIRRNLHNADLVYCTKENVDILLTGNEAFLLSEPVALDENRIALVCVERGIRFIGIFDMRDRKLARLVANETKDPFRYVRDISVSDGDLFFSYNDDDTFSRLGLFDGDSVRLDSDVFSGGVFKPVMTADGTIWYEGRFSDGSRLMKYPRDADAIGTAKGGRTISCALEPYDPAPGAAEMERRIEKTRNEFAERPFNVLPWYNPLRFWIPYPVLPLSGYVPEGVGVHSEMADPAGDVSVRSDLSWRNPFAFCDASLDAVILFPGVTATMSARDSLQATTGAAAMDRRLTGGSLGFSGVINLVPVSNTVSFGLGGTMEAVFAPGAGNESSPYLWAWSEFRSFVSASVGFSNLRNYGNGRYGIKGFSVDFVSDLNPISGDLKFEGIAKASIEGLPFLLSGFGGWSPESLFTFSGRTIALPERHRIFPEYALETAKGTWTAGGEIAARFKIADVQNEFSHLYVNYLETRLGWRGAAVGTDSVAEFRHSAFMSFEAMVTPIAGMGSSFNFHPYAEAALKLNGVYDGFIDGNDFSISLGLRGSTF